MTNPKDLVTFEEAREAAEVLVVLMREKGTSPEDRVYCAAEIIHMYSREVRIVRDRAAVQKVADAAGAMGMGMAAALPGFTTPVLEHIKEVADGERREFPGLPREEEEDHEGGCRDGGTGKEPGERREGDSEGTEGTEGHEAEAAIDRHEIRRGW